MEKSYNVLWWTKNVRQYRFGSPQAPGTNATSQKHFEALWKSMPTRAEAVLEVKRLYTRYWAKSFVAVAMWCRVGTRGLAMDGGCRTCTGAHSYSTTTHCKNFLSLASPFLLCCNASIFFSHFIFFSLLCCYTFRRWNCSWSTFRYILLLGL